MSHLEAVVPGKKLYWVSAVKLPGNTTFVCPTLKRSYLGRKKMRPADAQSGEPAANRIKIPASLLEKPRGVARNAALVDLLVLQMGNVECATGVRCRICDRRSSPQ